MTMIKRTIPTESAHMALTQIEIEVLDQWINYGERMALDLPSTRFLVKFAQLGGYLA